MVLTVTAGDIISLNKPTQHVDLQDTLTQKKKSVTKRSQLNERLEEESFAAYMDRIGHVELRDVFYKVFYRICLIGVILTPLF